MTTNILSWITELTLQIKETLTAKATVTWITKKAKVREAVIIRQRIGVMVSELESTKKLLNDRIASALMDMESTELTIDDDDGTHWKAAIRVRAGREKVDMDVVKTTLVEMGVPVNVVSRAFKAATTVGESSTFVDVRALKSEKGEE